MFGAVLVHLRLQLLNCKFEFLNPGRPQLQFTAQLFNFALKLNFFILPLQTLIFVLLLDLLEEDVFFLAHSAGIEHILGQSF